MKNKISNGRYAGEKQSYLTGDRYETCDSPGFDGFDDGLGADGKLKSTGTNVVEGGDNYMEDKGPNDLCHHEGEVYETIMELDPEISISSAHYLEKQSNRANEIGLGKHDAAAKWLAKPCIRQKLCYGSTSKKFTVGFSKQFIHKQKRRF